MLTNEGKKEGATFKTNVKQLRDATECRWLARCTLLTSRCVLVQRDGDETKRQIVVLGNMREVFTGSRQLQVVELSWIDEDGGIWRRLREALPTSRVIARKQETPFLSIQNALKAIFGDHYPTHSVVTHVVRVL
eukprot:9238525-Pyramimonas_sp.AAC.2